MNIWKDVKEFEDGEYVNAKTLNVPVEQLAARTDYLKRRLDVMLDNGVSVCPGAQ